MQRVTSASVIVADRRIGACGPGLLVLLGVHHDDQPANADKMADRIAGLRIFADEAGKMNLDLPTVGGSVLAISNFTVYGDAARSRRPSFTAAAGYDRGRELFDHFVESLRKTGIRVETGEFGADMQVTLTNDGPVTLVIEA